MNGFKKDRFPNDGSEFAMRTKIDVPLDYCSVCFIAFGSQERRIYVNQNVVHIDCANKARSR
jgi:hypothetical protein